MELALDTFGAPDINRWECDSDNEYVIGRLRIADDDVLIELKLYFEGNGASVLVATGPGSWEAGRFRLFFSHTSAHKVMAKEIRDHLRPYGFDVFVAHEDIKPTREWEEAPWGCIPAISSTGWSGRWPSPSPAAFATVEGRADGAGDGRCRPRSGRSHGEGVRHDALRREPRSLPPRGGHEPGRGGTARLLESDRGQQPRAPFDRHASRRWSSSPAPWK
jgi:hypothetical protein